MERKYLVSFAFAFVLLAIHTQPISFVPGQCRCHSTSTLYPSCSAIFVRHSSSLFSCLLFSDFLVSIYDFYRFGFGLISISSSSFNLDLVAHGDFSLVVHGGFVFLFHQFLFWFGDDVGKTVIVP